MDTQAKKIIIGAVLITWILLGVTIGLSAKIFNIIRPVSAGYYDKTAESILTPLRSCDYIVDFEFYGRLVKVVGMSKKIRRKLKSSMPKIRVNKMVYTQKEHYDGYHKEEHEKYFLAQVPPDGYMQINYVFTDRRGNIMTHSEKIFKPIYHQIFPSKRVIPRQCLRDGSSRNMRSFRD